MKDVDPSMKQFYTFRDSLTTVQGVLFFENRLYIPDVKRDRVLKEIHDGHPSLSELQYIGIRAKQHPC